MKQINYRGTVVKAKFDEIVANLVHAMEMHDQGERYEVWIRKRKRSNDQNDYFHKMLREISHATGHTVEELKHHFVTEVFGTEEFEVGGVKYERPISTASLPVDDMVTLNSHVETFYAEI
tara:strand:+ start:5587 stop:5946 length:360 start_codon:yes stop_codon:yes gene_type:complete